MIEILGLQKMTLLDFPGRIACTLFLGGCNLRCPYCHNPGLVTGPFPPAISRDELLAFLKKRQGLLDGVCVTGGEPLLHGELAGLLAEIKRLGYPVKLDTNGCFPQGLRDLVEGGLVDYVAMDVKSSPAGYAAAAGTPQLKLEAVSESVSYLLSRPVAYEFRTTVVGELHRDQTFLEIGAWIAGAEAYYLQGYVDTGETMGPALTPPTGEDLRRYRDLVRPYVTNVQIRGT